MIWACDENGGLYRKEGDGDRSAREEEVRKCLRADL